MARKGIASRGARGAQIEPLDFYCERLGPGLWAEPVNALSNAGFFVAAWMAWRFARGRGALDAWMLILIALLAAIGVGSTLFHTFADTRTHFLDTTPILVFQLAFLWCYCRRVIRTGPLIAFFALGAFLAVGLYARRFPEFLNGSVAYAPALLVLVCLGAFHAARALEWRWSLVAAAVILTVSLAFRTIDQALCDALPWGTHFLWHLLNSVVLYLCVRSVARDWQPARIQPNSIG